MRPRNPRATSTQVHARLAAARSSPAQPRESERSPAGSQSSGPAPRGAEARTGLWPRGRQGAAGTGTPAVVPVTPGQAGGPRLVPAARGPQGDPASPGSARRPGLAGRAGVRGPRTRQRGEARWHRRGGPYLLLPWPPAPPRTVRTTARTTPPLPRPPPPPPLSAQPGQQRARMRTPEARDPAPLSLTPRPHPLPRPGRGSADGGLALFSRDEAPSARPEAELISHPPW